MSNVDCGSCPNITDGCRGVCEKIQLNVPRWFANWHMQEFYESKFGAHVRVEDYCAAQAELTALREDLARLEEVTNFKEAVACVFDMLKYAACNTSDKSWDDQLEDLADDVIEFAPGYKKQWKDIGELSAKLSAAEQRNAELVELLKRAEPVVRGRDIYGAKQLANEIKSATAKPTESGASE